MTQTKPFAKAIAYALKQTVKFIKLCIAQYEAEERIMKSFKSPMTYGWLEEDEKEILKPKEF